MRSVDCATIAGVASVVGAVVGCGPNENEPGAIVPEADAVVVPRSLAACDTNIVHSHEIYF